jgi:outer membrane protein assembly factor BamB
MFAPSSSGHLWIVPPSGPASSAFPFPANTGPVGPPTVGPNGIIYVTAGADADNPFSTGSLFAINPDSGQTIFQVGSSSATQPVALDGAGNVYIDNNGGLEQLNANGNVRWGFNPPGPPQVLSPPMVYGSTAYVTAGPRLGVQQGHLFAVAISTATGKQLWATPIQGSFQNQSFGPALGGSGNVIVQTSNVLTALNRTTGQVAWTEQLVNGNAMVEPMVDGSGDVYVMGNAASGGGGYAQGFSASGQSLWEENFGTPSPFGTFGSPTGGAIGVDGSVYVSATDGKVYAFTDPS